MTKQQVVKNGNTIGPESFSPNFLWASTAGIVASA